MIVMLAWDPDADVLYVKTNGKIVTSREAPHDSGLILNMDGNGNVTGLQILDASKINAADWVLHPDVGMIQDFVRSSVTGWLCERELAA